MYSIRIIAAVLLGSLVVNAAPMPAVAPHHVQPGSVFTAKPAHFDPPLPGHSGPSGHRSHPVVALGHPDHQGWVPVAAVSHNHPPHMQTAVHDAQRYDHHTHADGRGGFNHGSQIAVGNPTHVHVDDLHHVHPESNLPHQLHHTDTHNLVNAVHHASGFRSNNPPHPVPAPRTPPWRKH